MQCPGVQEECLRTEAAVNCLQQLGDKSDDQRETTNALAMRWPLETLAMKTQGNIQQLVAGAWEGDSGRGVFCICRVWHGTEGPDARRGRERRNNIATPVFRPFHKCFTNLLLQRPLR